MPFHENGILTALQPRLDGEKARAPSVRPWSILWPQARQTQHKTCYAMLLSGKDDNIKCQADRRDALRSWNCSLAQARP